VSSAAEGGSLIYAKEFPSSQLNGEMKMNMPPEAEEKDSNLPCTLDSVIGDLQLSAKPGSRFDSSGGAQLLINLTRQLSGCPQMFFQTLVDTTLRLSEADSAGISLLSGSEKRFIWPAVAGTLSPYVGDGTPREFGPCGTVLDRNRSLLFIHPERHFTYLPITPALEEVLLVPFHLDKKAVGTLWAVIHTKERRFATADRVLLEALSEFAAKAYKVLAEIGGLESLIGPRIG